MVVSRLACLALFDASPRQGRTLAVGACLALRCVALPSLPYVSFLQVRIQLMATMAPDAPKPSFPVLLTHMVRAEGLSSVYAGLSAAIMRQAIYGTARIGLHRTFSDKLKEASGLK